MFFLGVIRITIRITSVACAVGPNVTMSLTYFSFQHLVFKILFEFLAIEVTEKYIYFPHFESKSYQINPIKC
jgi:hypothetical protein